MGNKVTIKVFISCPMDVDNLANIVYDKCTEYSNLLMCSPNKIMIKPFYWKKDIVSEIDITRDTLSVIMDQKRLKFEGKDEDIYIGIMWKRYGDKLEKKDFSPTEQEYRWALDKQEKTGSPYIQFYFKKSSKSVPSNKEFDEIYKVNRFGESIKKMNIGLYDSFQTNKKFKKKIINTLKYYIKNKTYLTYKKGVSKKRYKFDELESYIPRRIYDLKDEDKFYLIEPEKYSKELVNLIQKEKKIVLLGDAGTGKTFELQRVAQYYSDDDKPLYPIYTSLNLYVDENLESYLPAEWKDYIENPQMDENHILVILDGFDEVLQKSIAQRKILAFCEKHPDVHFLISCRSNFYKKETKEGSGTLDNFLSYGLLGLTESQITDYLNKKLTSKRAEEFIKNIYSQKLYYLLEIPFYLINLVSYYSENGTLPKSKADIFKYLLKKRIILDEQKYNEMELEQEKTRIFNTLEKLALGMELLCKNQISDDEYYQIITDKDLRNLIKHSTCWKNLKFEHNNFQEFLAANALSKLEFSQIQKIITFSPEHKRIIPSWTNTISFLFSILDKDNTLLIELKNWIVGTQPNILLCAEPDKIEKSIRFEIFKNIFNSYKEKGLWINIQKFTNWDFVKFGESVDTIDFLIDEISPQNPLISREEAISLIGYFSNPYNKKDIIKEKLLSIIFSKYESNYIKYLSMLTLSNYKKIINEEEIEKIIHKFKNSEDDNIRYAMYRLINKYELTDKYIEVFLEGIKFTGKSFYKEDKPINSGEILQIEEGLANSKEITSLEKIIKYFKENPDDIDNACIESSFDIIIRNIIEIYKSTNNNSIFNIMFDFTTSFKERYYYDDFYKKTITFFEKTDTLFNAFIKVYKTTIDLRKKMILLSNLSNNETLEFIIEEYENRIITNDFIISYQNYLRSNNYKYYDSFNNLLIKKYGDKFKIQPQMDYKKQREERLKKDIRLLFDKKAFIDEIKLIFKKIGKFNPNEKDLFKFDTDNWENRYYSKIIYNTLLSFANEKTISVESVIKTFDDSNFWDKFKIINIYNLMNKKEYIPKNKQKKWIENWCISNVKKVNFKTENKKTVKGYSRSWLSVYLVYFMKELNISYDENIMLDILSFVSSLESIDFIEKYVSPNKVSVRILSNLKDGIEIEEVLANHINYCINNKLYEVLNYVYDYLLLYEKDNFRIKELRNVSLEAILALAYDYKNLKETLSKIKDDYKWIIVDKFIENNVEIKFIENYLLKKLKDTNKEDSFEASEYLILLENIYGLKYYVEYVRKNKKFRYRFWKESPFGKLTNVELTPLLIELLEIDFNEKIEQDKYESLYKHVTNALKSIALYSEENYLMIKLSVENFINKGEKIKTINRLYYFLEDLEFQFYINKGGAIEIKEVVSRLKELNFS